MNRNKPYSTKEFVTKARSIHGAKWDYSKTVYLKSQVHVKIKCPVHGIFQQTPNKHLIGHGCPQCQGRKRYSTESWIAWAKTVHGDKYTYSKVNYKANDVKVIITCKLHGDFEQEPANHVRGHGCPHCKGLSTNRFLRKLIRLKGFEFELQGYEHHALRWMTKTMAVPVKEIKHGAEVPVIQYTLAKKRRRHYPDFWIPNQNRLVEVKSWWTLLGRKTKWLEILAKRKAAIKAGYLYTVLVFNSAGQRVKLPENWFDLSAYQVNKVLSRNGK